MAGQWTSMGCEHELRAQLGRHRDGLTTATSGHAYMPDLQRLARAIPPKRLVPIHSFAPERYGEFFENIEVHRDGEWWKGVKLRLPPPGALPCRTRLRRSSSHPISLGDGWRDPGAFQLEGGFAGLSPSIAAFYYLLPAETPTAESPSAFGDDRILLLKIAGTFTGLAPAAPQAKAVAHGVFGVARLPGIDAFDDLPKSYVPCFGGAIQVTLEGTGGQASGAYIRDVFPRRQEMVVNEVVGSESLNRQSSRVSVTKTTNLSGGGSYAGVSASASQGTTATAESQRESSQRNSHTTNIEHVHHVLTAYHLGSEEAVLTVQPRPFEGEYWELVGGIRKVEGIQECVVTVHVPATVNQFRVRVRFFPGWFWTQPGPIALRRPLDPAEKARAAHGIAQGARGRVHRQHSDRECGGAGGDLGQGVGTLDQRVPALGGSADLPRLDLRDRRAHHGIAGRDGG